MSVDRRAIGGDISQPPGYWTAFWVWARIGLLSFGGPAGQIALMHTELVDKRRWLSERGFLDALNFCMLLPGPEAMQIATYCGWRLHGLRGGLTAGLWFVLPGAALMALLAGLYLTYGALDWVQQGFVGIKAAVLVLVVLAFWKIARRALASAAHWWVAAASFVGLFFLTLPYPLMIAAAALAGLLLRLSTRGSEPHDYPVAGRSFGATLQVALSWLLAWFAPILALGLATGWASTWSHIARFFSQLAVVTFGGAYAVLAYMAQAAVETHGWLTGPEMLDALGLAETTPGPLILVTEFVGAIAAARITEPLSLWRAGLGAALTLYVTFVPCFLWIFTFAPYISRLNAVPALRRVLSGISAAVVGAVLNLSAWFALQTLWPGASSFELGPLRLWSLPPTALDLQAVALVALAALLLVRLKLPLLLVLAVSAFCAMAIANL